MKLPPTYTSLPPIAIALTVEKQGVEHPLTPPPNADQLLPSHLAILLALMPPAVVNLPPTYTLVPLTASVRATSFRPLLNDDQLVPFHLAILFALTLPAVVKLPPTYTSVPLTTSAKIDPLTPGRPNLSSQFSSPRTEVLLSLIGLGGIPPDCMKSG